MAQRRESRARLAGKFLEGKLNMLFNRNHKAGPAMGAGRILLASFSQFALRLRREAQTSTERPRRHCHEQEDLMNMQVTSLPSARKK